MKLFERILNQSSTRKTGEVDPQKGKKPDQKKSPARTHLFVRYGEQLLAGKQGTIEIHQKLAEKKGFVWFGKFGKTVNRHFIERVKTEKEPIYAFFFKGKKVGAEFYRGQIFDIQTDDLRQTKEKDWIPEYYRNETIPVGFWLKIKGFEKLDCRFLSRLIVASSRSPIQESLGSSNGTIFVEIEDG